VNTLTDLVTEGHAVKEQNIVNNKLEPSWR